MVVTPIVIIGAGPAGLAAAMQLSRQGQEFVLLERGLIGGLLLNANLVENYPGFVDGISGPELVELFRKQAERLGVEINHEDVKSVDFDQNAFRIATNKRKIEAIFLVAAAGTKPRTLPAEILSGVNPEKVFTEVYPLVRKEGKEIIILGAGDAALDYALNLAEKNRIILLNRGARIKALGLLWERVQNVPEIEYHSNQKIEDIKDAVGGRIRVSTSSGIQKKSFEADYLITAIGRDPELEFAQDELLEKKDRLISEGRLYFIGDLHNGSFRQTAMAVGDGIKAAMSIGQKLEE